MTKSRVRNRTRNHACKRPQRVLGEESKLRQDENISRRSARSCRRADGGRRVKSIRSASEEERPEGVRGENRAFRDPPYVTGRCYPDVGTRPDPRRNAGRIVGVRGIRIEGKEELEKKTEKKREKENSG